MADAITKATFETSEGTFTIEFLHDKAPETCKNFITLAQDEYYDNLTFHRIIKGFMIQGGCPQGTGTGGPGYTIRAEFNDTKHAPGVVSMARSMDPDSAGSQFFICVDVHSHLDNQYTAFATVTDGYDVIEKISSVAIGPNDKPLTPVVINKVTLS